MDKSLYLHRTMRPEEVHRPSDELIKRYLTRRYNQDKYNRMKAIVLAQLQEYSVNGERLYRISRLNIYAQEAREYTKLILEEIFRDGSKSRIIYELIFGYSDTSYHSLRFKCNQANPRFKLKTTPKEWFYSIPNRLESGKVSRSYVKVECEHGHETYKRIDTIGDWDCSICTENKRIEEGWYNTGNREIKYGDLLDYLNDTPFDFVYNRKEFKDAINEAKYKGKSPCYAILRWKHKDCGHEFDRSYTGMMISFTCPKCSQKKNQKITHGLCEYAFDSSFEVEKSLKKIFDIDRNPELKDLHSNVHIDISQKLSDLIDKNGSLARDKNGNIIILSVEYNGKQHHDSPEGFNTFIGISRHRDVEYRSEKWRALWKQWRVLIKTDKIKRELFAKNKRYGFHLIEVDYSIPVSQRLGYIYSRFEEETGVKLEHKKNIDWRFLL